MPVIAKDIKGKDRYYAIRAHRLAVYCKAYVGYLDGTSSLGYLNERLSKLCECGIDVSVKGKGGVN